MKLIVNIIEKHFAKLSELLGEFARSVRDDMFEKH